MGGARQVFKSKKQREDGQRPGKHWGRWFFVLLLFAAGGGVAAVWLSPAPVIEWAVTRILTNQGLGPVSLRVDRANWREFVAHDFVLGAGGAASLGPDLSVGEVRLDYGLNDLVHGRIRKVILKDVHVAARMPGRQGARGVMSVLSFGVLDELVAHVVSGGGPVESQPFEVKIDRGLITVVTPAGPVRLNFGVTRTRGKAVEIVMHLADRTGKERPQDIAFERFDALWRQSETGVQEARLDVRLKHLKKDGAALEGAAFTLVYGGDAAQGKGTLDVSMPVLSVPKKQSAAVYAALPPQVRAAFATPIIAPFAGETGLAFSTMLEAAKLEGRLTVIRGKSETVVSFQEPLVLSRARPPGPQTKPATPSWQLSLGNAETSKPFLVFRGKPEGQVEVAGQMRMDGAGSPSLDVGFEGRFAAPAASPSAATGHVRLEMAPWRVGESSIGARGFDISFQGSAQKFAGRVTGQIDLDGVLVGGVRVKEGRLDVAGRFERDQNGFIYTQAGDACMALRSMHMQFSNISLERPILSFCSDKGAPIFQALFAPDHPVQILIDMVIPSEKTQLKIGPDFYISGKFPAINLYTEYLSSSGQWRITYGLYEGALVLGHEAIKLSGLKLSGIVSGVAGIMQDATAALDHALVSDAADFSRFAPLSLVGQSGLSAGQVVFSGAATDQSGRTMGEFEGRHDMRTGQGRIEGKMPALSFAPAGLQPQDWLPLLKGVVAQVEGGAKGDFSIRWGEGRLKSSAHLTLTEIKLATSIGPMTGINGEITLSSLWPPVTQKPQIIRIREIDIGTELLFGVLSFSVNRKGEVILENADWPWAGGTIGIAHTELYFDDRPQKLVLTAQGIDLQEVFTLLDVDGLAGTGILAGKLPVTISQGTIDITDGQLVSTGQGGTLQYQGSASQAASGAQGSSLLFNALKDFHYDELKVFISGRTTDVLTVSIVLNGYNPGVLDGYPIKLNVKTEGPLVEMIRQGTIGYRVPNQIRQKLKQKSR